MKRLGKSFVLHSSHLFVIGLLGFFVLKNIRQSGETVLYSALNRSLEKADVQVQASAKYYKAEICKQVEAYPHDERMNIYRRAAAMNNYTEKVRREYQNRFPTSPGGHQMLASFCDSLYSSVHYELEFYPVFKKILWQPANTKDSIGLVATMAHARAAQLDLLHNNFSFNIALSNEMVQENFLRWVSGHERIPFYYYRPYMAPTFGFPIAGRPFTSKVFMINYFGGGSNFFKAWVNGDSIPIKRGQTRFSTTFDQPGPQDISLRIETDCFCCDRIPQVFEKTYLVNVQPQ